MRTKCSALFLLIAAFAAYAYPQSVVITPKLVKYKRPKPISEYKAAFEITYPKVKATTPALSRKIEKAIGYESIFPTFSLKEELDDMQWLESATYEVGYNENAILSMSETLEGSGAYPSATTKHFVVDLRTGNIAKTADSFINLSALRAIVRKEMIHEIAAARAELKKGSRDDLEGFNGSIMESAKYQPLKLDQYSVSKKGVTFHHDYGFPHVILALQPAGEFFFTWARIKPYLKPGGLLAKAAR